MLTLFITMGQFVFIDFLLVFLGFCAMLFAWLCSSRNTAFLGVVCTSVGLLGPHFPEVTIGFVVAVLVWGIWKVIRG